MLFTPQSLTNKLQFTFARAFWLPLSLGRGVLLSTRTEKPLGSMVSRCEYDRLQNYLVTMEEELIQKHLRVEELSGLRERLYALEGAGLMVADIIWKSFSRLHSELMINRGEKDGLAEGQFVLGDNSIIGTVCYVDAQMAKVKLVTDPSSKIAVNIAGTSRLMQGIGNNTARILELLRKKHEVKVGDIVTTAKKPGVLDVPIVTGTVQRCQSDDENPLLWDITVRPACNIEQLDTVAVIIMNPKK